MIYQPTRIIHANHLRTQQEHKAANDVIASTLLDVEYVDVKNLDGSYDM